MERLGKYVFATLMGNNNEPEISVVEEVAEAADKYVICSACKKQEVSLASEWRDASGYYCSVLCYIESCGNQHPPEYYQRENYMNRLAINSDLENVKKIGYTLSLRDETILKSMLSRIQFNENLMMRVLVECNESYKNAMVSYIRATRTGYESLLAKITERKVSSTTIGFLIDFTDSCIHKDKKMMELGLKEHRRL